MSWVLFQASCPICGAAGASACRACLDAVRPAPLLPPPAGVDCCHALFAYEGAGRELVAGLKYRNHRAVLRGLGGAVASLVAEPVDVVTWAPTTPARRRSRGFDQAELLARMVALALGRPASGLLRRAPGPPQTGRSAAERWHGPAFTAARHPPARVLLVDDVVTTGATASAAARVLRDAGASSVLVAALARTPAPGSGPVAPCADLGSGVQPDPLEVAWTSP